MLGCAKILTVIKSTLLKRLETLKISVNGKTLFLRKLKKSSLCNCSLIVLVAIQDEGSIYVGPAIEALKELGTTDPILTDYRGSFALIGYSGVVKPSWVEVGQANRKQGPTELSKAIPLSPGGKNLFFFFKYLFQGR